MTKLFLSTIVLFAFIVMATANSGMTGGLGESRQPDDDVSKLVDRLKAEIIKKICDKGKGNCPPTDAEIIVNNYKTQTVAGTNYFVGATIGDEVYHIKIFSQPWTKTEQVHSVEGPKEKSEEITYF